MKWFSIGALINVYLKLVKASLALEVKNILDWLIFLALKTLAFLVYIHFLILLFGDYHNLSGQTLFHLNFVFALFYYLFYIYWDYFQHHDEWDNKLPKSLDELLIKINNSQKHLYFTYWQGFKPIIYGFDLFIFYLDAFMKDNIAEKLHTFLMKTIFFSVAI